MKKMVAALVTAVLCLLPVMFMINSGGAVNEFTSDDILRIKKERHRSKLPTFGFPDKAMEFYMLMRSYPFGKIPDGWREEAIKHIEANNRMIENSEALAWSQLGPGNIGGRVRSILINPFNSGIIYAASVSGGVWKTTNRGASWFPLKDNMENLAVCAMTFEGSNTNTIYAGTGEGYYNFDNRRGEGIFKTTDAGITWLQLPATKNSSFHHVNKLLFDDNSSTLWAATGMGLYKSTNGGSSFNTVFIGQGGAAIDVMDIDIINTDPRTIFVTTGLFSQSTIYVSRDGGNTFQVSATYSGIGRMEVAVSRSNTNRVYASGMALSSGQCGIFLRSTDRGETWTQTDIPGPSYAGAQTYTNSQGWYNNAIEVHPLDAGTVYAAGIDFWRSTNGGDSWTQLTNWYEETGAPPYVHADHHAIIFNPSNSSEIYLGTDGGVYRTVNGGTTWTSLNNNLFITQFYYGVPEPVGEKYYGGTQDNGTLKSTGDTYWSMIFGGDGGATEVDYNNPEIVYAELNGFVFLKSTNGGLSFTRAMNGIPKGPGNFDGTTDRTLFITPFVLDPNNSQTLVAGTYRVWRTTNGAAQWSPVSGDLTGDGTGSSGSVISSVAVAKGNSNVICAGATNGRLNITTNGGTSWSNISSGLPAGYITDIEFKQDDPLTLYVTFGGFLSGGKVYKTTNRGQSWQNISGNLPNIPVLSLIADRQNGSKLYAGTDLGIFTTTNGGTGWVQDNSGMANVAVYDLDYRESDSKLFAATHGRGVFSASVGAITSTTTTLIYDNGTAQGSYYWPLAGQASAVRMSAPVGNNNLISLSFYITGVHSGSATFTPVIYNSSSGTPSTEIAGLNQVTAANVPGWNDVIIPGSGVPVPRELFAGMRYDGVNRPQFGYNTFNNGRAWDYNGSSWSAFPQTYLFRATVRTSLTDITFENSHPEEFRLCQNYPNPFNPSTNIRYDLSSAGNVSVVIYTASGEEVVKLIDDYQQAGKYTVTWNGNGSGGKKLASGIYLCRITAGAVSETIKMVMMR